MRTGWPRRVTGSLSSQDKGHKLAFNDGDVWATYELVEAAGK